MRLALVVLSALLVHVPAQAKLFRNAYVSFELPPNWNCKLEGSEWVCENDFAARTKEAIIILTAKEAGPVDTLPQYLAYLQTPREVPGSKGSVAKSKVIHVKERLIGNHMWIDAMHQGSEIVTYFTRYLVTIKDKIAIVVTFSAHKDHYTKYSGDFVNAVNSMKVVATKDLLGSRPTTDTRPQTEIIGPATDRMAPAMEDISSLPPPESTNKGYLDYILLAIVLGAVGLVLYIRANKPKKKSKKK